MDEKKDDWIADLGLKVADKEVLETGAMLTDKHMHPAHKLLKKKFPDIQGCQSTLLEQNNGFKPVSASVVQIHYTGSMHLVCASNIRGRVELFDSEVVAMLTESLERQLAAIYHGSDEQLPVSRIAAQQ